MSSHLAHYLLFLPFLLLIFLSVLLALFPYVFTSTIHYVVLRISNKNLPLKKEMN